MKAISKLRIFAVTAFLLSLFSHAASVEKPVNFSGLWKNQRGSTLDFIQQNNLLKGTFVTSVAQTRACIGHKAPFTGYINSNTFSISVDMTGCGSPLVMAVTGIVSNKDGKEKIKTQALMQFKGKETWNSQILTTDFYTRITDQKGKALHSK